MSVAARPADLADIAALKPLLPAKVMAALQTQVLRSPAVTVTDDGRPVAMAGIYPHADHFEAWLVTAAGLRGSPAAGRAMRLLALLALALPEGMAVAAMVREDNAQGQRLARLMGFTPGPLVDGRRRFTLNRPPTALASGAEPATV